MIMEDTVSDPRSDLRKIFTDILEPKVNMLPETYMGISPIGEFADAAADYMGAAPKPPRYHPDEDQPVFSSPITMDDLADGNPYGSINTYASLDNGVQIGMRVGEHAHSMPLAVDIAEQFFLQGLAVVRHLRERGQS